jgi:hypothetical protein
VFGQIKEARGFRRFLLRGLANMRGEWCLVCDASSAQAVALQVCADDGLSRQEGILRAQHGLFHDESLT